MICKARASQVGKLMTPPKGKKVVDKDTPLSQTAKSYLDEVAIEKFYHRYKPLRTEPLRKGTKKEKEATTRVMRLWEEWMEANTKRYEDEYTTGFPDLPHQNAPSHLPVIDTKVSMDIWSFHANATAPIWQAWDGRDKKWVWKKDDYYWQLQTYIMLTGRPEGWLVYSLEDTPLAMFEDIKHREKFKFEKGDEDPEWEEHEKQLIGAHFYGDLSDEERTKCFKIERNEEDQELIRVQVEKSNEYLKDWKL